ncbi:MAG: TIGR02281 family clan AA aspartic protease [Gammaproteobacteria bacterium]|jgi:aspartyl protease family protein
MRYISGILLTVLFMVAATNVVALPRIEVQALFGGKAIVMIDGQRRTLSAGQTSPEGVKLIAADSKQAVLEYDGSRKAYQPGGAISLSYAKPEHHEEKIYADDHGMFHSVGTINGRTVRFLVDTGATTVAMNKSQARQLGVDYRMKGERIIVSTASENVKGYRVRLKSVSLGRIKQRDVDAMVIDGDHPGPILLGMSFLGNLKVEKSGGIMSIRQRN